MSRGGSVSDHKMTGHQAAALLEDIRWLMSPDGGSLSVASVAERLGMGVKDVENRLAAELRTSQRRLRGRR